MADSKARGIYALTLRLPRRTTATLGQRTLELPAGWYVYVGSAMSGLRSRIARHARTKGFRHWHIDSLLAAGRITDVQCCVTSDTNAECRLAARIAGRRDASPVPAFGASDCRCASHLTWSAQPPTFSIRADHALSQIDTIVHELRSRYVDHTAWDHPPFRTLVTCILSLRTKDPVTHAAAKRLFAVMSTPEAFANADPTRIAELIYPVGMYREKARHLTEIAQQISTRYNGQTPPEIDDLLTLPGVGRKTANLVRSFAFGLPAICVDIHVHRITNRLGLVRTAHPDDSERELRIVLPRQYWLEINPLLVQHGQQICRPTRPKCDVCPFRDACAYPELRQEAEILHDVPGLPGHPCLKLLPPAAS